MTETVTVTIDGRQLIVPKGTLVIRAAERLGITIPRFCDHPLLDPIGACRQCMVEVEGQRKPFTSCTTVCTDGMVVSTHLTSELARQAQEATLELLLINHPLDCPQCDKGGECPLQDQALAHGPEDSRFVDAKRRFVKPVPISAQIALDRERCVLCARCTRFSSEISGDPFIELFERGALEQVAIYEDEPYHSYFSGNVVQICPVGALTATSYRFKARPFDLHSTPGVCNQCSAGCNLRVDVRRGEIQRQLARENTAVNEMWNCDKGRFGYEFVAHGERLRNPVARSDLGGMEVSSWAAALRQAGERLAAALDAGGPSAVGVLTGGRLTDEDAYALSRFARDVLGTDNVDFRLRPRPEEVAILGAVAGTLGPTYEQVEAAAVVVVAGLDPEEEVPILHLRLRKAWRGRGQRIVAIGPVLGSLAELAWRWLPTGAGAEAATLAALADGSTGDAADAATLREVGQALRDAGQRVVVLAGERLAAAPGGLAAAARLATTLDVDFAWVPRRNNARGAVDAGLLPGVLPGGRTAADPGLLAGLWRTVPDEPGMDTRAMLQAAADGHLRALYLVGVDPARDFEDPRLARAALQRAESVIVQDLLATDTTRYADVILPAAAAQERVGSFTTWEGRRQPFPTAVTPEGLAKTDWDIIRQLALVMGVDLGWETATDVRREAAPVMEVPVRPTERLRQRLGSSVPAPVPAGATGQTSGPAEASSPSPLQEQHSSRSEDDDASASRPDVAPASRDDDGSGSAVGAGGRVGGDVFDVVVVDRLVGDGVMLAGAKALKETARPVDVWLNDEDAGRLGLVSGQTVRLEGGDGAVELPVAVTDGVVPGVVVLPGPSSGVAAAELVAPGAPVRVRLAPVTEEG